MARAHPPEQPSAWARLQQLAASVGGEHLRVLFARDPRRAARYTVSAAGITLDYSKQRIDACVMRALSDLADQQRLGDARQALFDGEAINNSEHRAAWHIALRRPADAPLHEGVHDIRAAMRDFVDTVRSGVWRGFTGRSIRDIVNIGTGGSDLGPRLACEALAHRHSGPRVHFVANIDPADLDDTLGELDPATTLVVVTSKSFATAETLANARAARRWLLAAGAGQADIARHFVAVSTDRQAARAFGISTVFGFWDWVGGRFSLWSSVGLAIALGLGHDIFESLLAGAHAMDEHFHAAPWSANLPVILALLGVWNRDALGLPGHVVAPYAQRLHTLARYLQQLEMESNGKSVTRQGEDVAMPTAPIVWGDIGTNAQHAFFQMLHQGALVADVDFVLPIDSGGDPDDEREQQRIANCLAQARALMCGRDVNTLGAQLTRDGYTGDALDQQLAARRFEGNRPSSMLLLDQLDAHALGALLAAYEHKVFVQGVIWNINSFDQWGVELGKTIADQIQAVLADNHGLGEQDASTAALIAHIRRVRG